MDYYITVTRFNESTWREHYLYKEKTNKLVYNSPCKITENIPVNSNVIVLEMHNDENRIKGIGLIKNYINHKKSNIFSEKNYNRYTYNVSQRIDRYDLIDYDESIMKFFDIICFKGYRHLKRGKGIQRIPNYIIQKCKSVLYFPKYFELLFDKNS